MGIGFLLAPLYIFAGNDTGIIVSLGALAAGAVVFVIGRFGE